MLEEMYTSITMNVEATCTSYGLKSLWGSTNTICRRIQRRSSLFTILEVLKIGKKDSD